MSSLKCNSSRRDNIKCKYNLDCNNSIKSNYAQYICPGNLKNTYNDKIDNQLMICNIKNDNESSKNISKRNIPDKPIKVNFPYRGTFKICDGKYKDLGMKQDSKTILKHSSNFTPGKIPIENYFDNINVENDLLIKTPHNKCFNRHMPNNITLQNQQSSIINLKDNSELPLKICPYYDSSKKHDIIDNKSENDNVNLYYNYDKIINTCNKDFLPSTQVYHYDNHVLAKQMNKFNMTNDKLRLIGPVRSEHKVENIWHNNSKRRFLSRI